MPAVGILRRTGAPPAVNPPVQVHQRPSPNCGPRRDGLTPRFVVIHHTAMASADAAIERLCAPEHGVSAHYVICKTGRVTQLVGEGLRAWHAGVGQWRGLDDLNSRSIGIELDNDGQGPFTQALMQSLEGLLARLLAGWDIPAENVIGHSDMAPGRKVDPGPWFDWKWLEDNGLAGKRGTRDTGGKATLAAFTDRARAAGYTSTVDPETLLSAVRLRYRPFATGPLSPRDVNVLPVPTPLG